MSDKKSIPDIKPTLTKDRSSLGKAEIFITEDSSVTAVGVIYGIEHTVHGEDFKAHLFLDHYNQRIRIQEYEGPNFHGLILRIRAIAEKNGFDKIICMAKRQDFQEFLKHGYVLEAVLKYFHNGEDAYVVSKFRSQERIISNSMMEEILLIEEIMTKPIHAHPKPPKAPSGFKVRKAARSDVPALIELYCSIFESYPSPLCHTDYLEHVFGKETIFAVAEHEGKIVAAASGEVYPEKKAVELTDCATLTICRGKGLMSVLLYELEKGFKEKGYICAYTMARGRSFGMNNVFFQLGYEFMGRLVNNCDIYGAYEDMNIWVKDLRQ